MGADLTIRKYYEQSVEKYEGKFNEACQRRNLAKSQKQKEKIQASVERYYRLMHGSRGYFRDSYNGTSVLNALGLSWWQDVIPMLDKKGDLSPEKAKELIDMVKEAKMPKIDLGWLRDNGLDSTDSPMLWRKYFVDKRRDLLKFLSIAVREDLKIHCSL